MFYIQAFSFVGLIFALWVSTWFTISLLLPPFFLLLLPFPSDWSYSLCCWSQPVEQHFLLTFILNYLFHVRLIQMPLGIQISWAWYCKPQSSSWEKKGHLNLVKAKGGGQACCKLSVPAWMSLVPPAWQKCHAILVLLASLWLPLPVANHRRRHHQIQDGWQSWACCTREQAIFHLGCLLAPDRCSSHFSAFNLSCALCSVFAHTASLQGCTLSILLFIKSFSKSPASLRPGRLIHHLFKMKNIRVNKIWIRRLTANRPNLSKTLEVITHLSHPVFLYRTQPFAFMFWTVLNFWTLSFLSAQTTADMSLRDLRGEEGELTSWRHELYRKASVTYFSTSKHEERALK